MTTTLTKEERDSLNTVLLLSHPNATALNLRSAVAKIVTQREANLREQIAKDVEEHRVHFTYSAACMLDEAARIIRSES